MFASITPLTTVLAILGLVTLAATWTLVQRWTGRYVGEEYHGTDADDVGRCGSCAKDCQRDPTEPRLH